MYPVLASVDARSIDASAGGVRRSQLSCGCWREAHAVFRALHPPQLIVHARLGSRPLAKRSLVLVPSPRPALLPRRVSRAAARTRTLSRGCCRVRPGPARLPSRAARFRVGGAEARNAAERRTRPPLRVPFRAEECQRSPRHEPVGPWPQCRLRRLRCICRLQRCHTPRERRLKDFTLRLRCVSLHWTLVVGRRRSHVLVNINVARRV